jgi:hypothetical protein
VVGLLATGTVSTEGADQCRIERLKRVEHLHQQISILTRLANDLGLEVTWMRLEGVEDCLRRNLAVLRLALDERC